jgi:hypothetical protein
MKRAMKRWAPTPDTNHISVHKFGGSSVGNAGAMESVLTHILLPHLNARRRPVAVLSAMLGVTNRLIDAARAAKHGQSSAFRDIRADLYGMHRRTLDGVLSILFCTLFCVVVTPVHTHRCCYLLSLLVCSSVYRCKRARARARVCVCVCECVLVGRW